MKALIISADNFEDSELLVPYYRLKEAGVEVTVASLSSGSIKGKHGYDVAVDKTLDEVNPDDYAILILPGGAAPALVRKEPKALEIARSFFTRNKPVAAICHGPQSVKTRSAAFAKPSLINRQRGNRAIRNNIKTYNEFEKSTARQIR